MDEAIDCWGVMAYFVLGLHLQAVGEISCGDEASMASMSTIGKPSS